MKKVFLAYIPVYHRGWENFLAAYPEVEELYLLSAEQLRAFGPTQKDVHGLAVEQMQEILRDLKIEKKGTAKESKKRLTKVAVFTEAVRQMWQKTQNLTVIIPADEVVVEWVRETLPPKIKVIKSDIFVRWTVVKSLAVSQPKTVGTMTVDEIKAKFARAWQEAEKAGQWSSDWWRQVGCALLLTNGKTVVAHNTHLPESQTPYMLGDVRAQFHKGDHIELTTAIHAEAKAIAEAAKKGWSTAGSTLIVTDFPCPVCAKLIGQAGIKELYYQKGYAMLDGETVLQAFGVKIYQIKALV